MSRVQTPEHKSAAEVIDEHRDLFEAIAEMDDLDPEFAEDFGAAPLRYAADHLEAGDE
ncbi:hypothetical protein ACFSBT_17850 [Halomarina rubra]|uniref:Uncharacterized protein n=2 Tax=Halomarina rubra TaxID=2071873 RepID=A0ABD6B0Q1_9EURY